MAAFKPALVMVEVNKEPWGEGSRWTLAQRSQPLMACMETELDQHPFYPQEPRSQESLAGVVSTEREATGIELEAEAPGGAGREVGSVSLGCKDSFSEHL